MAVSHFTYYGSYGFVVEYLDPGEERCYSWLLLPAENLWPEYLRGLLYTIALIYLFVGIAIASDIFMCSIEVITSKKRKIQKWDAERGEMIDREVLIWNETVANLTLMALGSSAPEILLAVIESCSGLASDEPQDSLGTFTIIGSAAFNLLIITAVCIVSVPSPQSKSIKEFGVFIMTGIWSIWAYIWMLLVVKYITPGEVDPWEAWVTLLFLPLLVVTAYLQDSGWCCGKLKIGEASGEDATAHVRVVASHPHPQLTGHTHKGLHLMEAQKAHRMSEHPVHATSESASPTVPEKTVSQSTTMARARFRHAVVGSLLGSRALRPHSQKGPRMADVAQIVKSWNDSVKQGKPPDMVDSLGKFTFGSDRYAVLESAGSLNIEIFFHRRVPAGENGKANGTTTNRPRSRLVPPSTNGTILTVEEKGEKGDGKLEGHANSASPNSGITSVVGAVTVDFETREGSAKPGKDFMYSQGTLVFQENEYRKTITIPIINDNQYEADVDFYVILKNPHGGAGIGDPSITRITIVDDDEPGEFEFEETHYHLDNKTGKVILRVMREHGFDGKVSMDYSTTDGTAVGGKTLGTNVDYVASKGTLTFEHGETSKTLSIDVNKNVKESKNFIVTLRNPSLGALIGPKSAAVCHFNRDELIERVADVLDDEEEEEVTWGGQFINAMTVSVDPDDDGNEVEPKWYHYLLHFITFFWKVFCSIIPPTFLVDVSEFKWLWFGFVQLHFWKVFYSIVPPRLGWKLVLLTKAGAWPSFVLSLFFIGMMTACVEQLGKLLGCVIGIKTSVTGITIIALGTSLPDTFASRTAARQDESADAAIGNVTGSNSVNVFLGLGLPWVISTMYHLAKGTSYKVKTDNLTQSVIIFSVCGTLCLMFLVFRRKFMGGELGGANTFARLGSSGFLVLLWLVYVVLSSLKAYDLIL